MNVTAKMCTAIVTFTYFISEIQRTGTKPMNTKNLNGIRTVRCGFYSVTVIKYYIPTSSVRQTDAAVVEERPGLFLLLAVTRRDNSGEFQ